MIVVSGLPRSGTSLVMSMLDAGGVPVLVDDERPADESNPRGYFELAAVKRTASDAGWIDAAPGHAVKVVHALLSSLPPTHRYEVLLVERDLGEVAASQRAMLDRAGAGPPSAMLERGGAGSPSAAGDEARLVDALRRQLDEARHWLAVQPNVRWVPLAHRRLIRDPGTAASEIARFLDRALDLDAMAARVDPALHRARRAR